MSQNFQHLLPRVDFHYQFQPMKNLDFNYSSSVNAQQLQPIADESDPLNVVLGNPNLRPEYAHNLQLNFSMFNPEIFRSFFGSRPRFRVIMRR